VGIDVLGKVIQPVFRFLAGLLIGA